MPSKKLIAKIRKEGKFYLAYFLELRRIIPVNESGAIIIDYFFNKKKPVLSILKLLSRNKGFKLKVEEIEDFLKKLREELDAPYEGGYPVLETERMKVPLAVELQLNTTCNLKCEHCCQANYVQTMPLKKAETILRILYKTKVFEVILVGGEVFLYPYIKYIIDLCCRKYRFATLIVTNGTLLTSSLINNLLKYKENLSFLVSLEGIKDINDRIRGKGTFDKIDKTLKSLKKAGFYLEISTTVNNLNIGRLQDLIDYGRALNIPINFNLFKPFKDGQDSLILPPNKYFDFVEKIFQQRLTKKFNIGLTNAAITAYLLNQGKRNECKATLSGLTIDVNGRMVPCPFLEEIGFYKSEDLPLFGKNFLDNWKNNKYFKEFRKRNMTECQACSYIFKGNINQKSPYGISAFKDYQKSRNSYAKII